MKILKKYVTKKQAELLLKKGFEFYVYYPEQWEVIEWFRIKHKINIEANYLSNINKYRWLAKPMNIIPKNYKSRIEYAKAVDKYYGKLNYNTPHEALKYAIDCAIKTINLK